MNGVPWQEKRVAIGNIFSVSASRRNREWSTGVIAPNQQAPSNHWMRTVTFFHPGLVPPSVSWVQFPTRNSQIAIHQPGSSPSCPDKYPPSSLLPLTPQLPPTRQSRRTRPTFRFLYSAFALQWSHHSSNWRRVSIPRRDTRCCPSHHILTSSLGKHPSPGTSRCTPRSVRLYT